MMWRFGKDFAMAKATADVGLAWDNDDDDADEEEVDGRMIVLCPFWFCNFAYGWFLGFFSQILGHFSHICIVKQFCKA